MTVNGDTSSSNSKTVCGVFRVDVDAREMLCSSSLHLSLFSEVLCLDVEDVTVCEHLVRKLVSVWQAEWILHVRVHASDDENSTTMLHTCEVLQTIWQFKVEVISGYHDLSSLL